eukprot:NODE_49_length_31687_cov_0.791123.p20 type:complete len:117 gc:universal NODE_49_length_31687_cov_0.791123:6956-7306(+)
MVLKKRVENLKRLVNLEESKKIDLIRNRKSLERARHDTNVTRRASNVYKKRIADKLRTRDFNFQDKEEIRELNIQIRDLKSEIEKLNCKEVKIKEKQLQQRRKSIIENRRLLQQLN